MDLAAFKVSRAGEAPPDGLGNPLAALWQEANGDWKATHRLAQRERTEAARWVHAYLHRVEGDLKNAKGWYRRAGRPAATGPLAAEWEAIAAALLREAADVADNG